jgi:hypothetical protein
MLEFLWGKVGGRIEPLHLGSDLGRITGGIETGQTPDPALALD